MQDLTGKITGSTLTATEWNQVPSEIQNIITAMGISLSSGDLNQLGKGIAGYIANGNYYTDSGSADAYALSVVGSKQAPADYVDGMQIMFSTTNANTGGAATVNVASLGAKSITLSDGSNPPAGTIDGRVVATYNSSSNRFEVSRKGYSQITVVTSTDASWAPETDTKSIEFTAVGGGGGGGGVDGQGSGTAAGAGGGAGGGTSIIRTSTIDSTYNITIGAGGTGGAAGNNSGTTGGTTSVVSASVSISAAGGTGGTGMLAISGSAGAQGGNGGTASGGDLNLTGGDGISGRAANGNLTNLGAGGASLLGGAVKAIVNSDGVDATTYGGGGSGGSVDAVTTNYAGGDGYAGVVIIKEFF